MHAIIGSGDLNAKEVVERSHDFERKGGIHIFDQFLNLLIVAACYDDVVHVD